MYNQRINTDGKNAGGLAGKSGGPLVMRNVVHKKFTHQMYYSHTVESRIWLLILTTVQYQELGSMR
jgi:hypothetical protein